MDESASNITFNNKGFCNYCEDFLVKRSKHIPASESLRINFLNELVAMVKKDGSGKPYDCIVGISGGVDSSWVLVQAVKLGLRPLAVHMDSGWNSEIAQNNIENLVKILNVDLYTHVIEWPEIRGLMEAFFKADVIDVDVLYDNAMLAVNYNLAAKYKIKYILAGTNIATEGIDIPPDWNWYKSDKKNIVGISKKFDGPKIKTFPSISTIDTVIFTTIKKIRWVSFLDYTNYKKNAALEVLKSEFGYKPYIYKHYESVFTRFYQGYILPFKFGVDKRKPHLSSLIMSGEITRDEALKQVSSIAYSGGSEMESDRLYFIKKMGWTEEGFKAYMGRPGIKHDVYPTEVNFYKTLLFIYRKFNFSVGRTVIKQTF